MVVLKDNLLLNYDILKLNDIIKSRKFIILLNTKQHDFNLLRLKDALLKENCSSGM
jgi:hypothetical protein